MHRAFTPWSVVRAERADGRAQRGGSAGQGRLPNPSEVREYAAMPMSLYGQQPSRRGRCCLFVLLALVGFFPSMASAQQVSGSPRLTYIKEFKGAIPEYQAVTVDTTGAATYEGRQLDEPSRPRSLQLSAATTSGLFDLAARLGDFGSLNLEGRQRVANLGWKTLRYEKNGVARQVQFNFTLRKEANELVNAFEKIACVAQHQTTLEYAMKYDHLNLPRELRQIKIDLAQKAVADSELLIPALEKIAQNSRYLNVAKEQAQVLLQEIQSKR
jgi:hypothetical protein